jgi:hypothetical protein
MKVWCRQGRKGDRADLNLAEPSLVPLAENLAINCCMARTRCLCQRPLNPQWMIIRTAVLGGGRSALVQTLGGFDWHATDLLTGEPDNWARYELHPDTAA